MFENWVSLRKVVLTLSINSFWMASLYRNTRSTFTATTAFTALEWPSSSITSRKAGSSFAYVFHSAISIFDLSPLNTLCSISFLMCMSPRTSGSSSPIVYADSLITTAELSSYFSLSCRYNTRSPWLKRSISLSCLTLKRFSLKRNSSSDVRAPPFARPRPTCFCKSICALSSPLER